MIEIELKAWVDEPEILVKILCSKAKYLRDFDKKDEYFRLTISGKADPFQDVRIRQDDKKCLVTYKDKTMVDGVEFNREHEFGIESPEMMTELLLRLGALKLVSKRKKGSAWKFGDFLVELSQVENLGYFIEIETVLANTASFTHAELSTQLKDALRELGITSDRIEERSYTSMLINTNQ